MSVYALTLGDIYVGLPLKGLITPGLYHGSKVVDGNR